jgi:protease I
VGIFSEKEEDPTLGRLQGRRIAILATDGFEQSELLEPKRALEQAGALVKIVSPRDGEIKAWNKTDWGESVRVDSSLEEAEPNDFDGLVLPGGVMNPDKLRMNERAVEFVRHFVTSGKPIAAICHGPWTLIETGGVKGRTMTSYLSIKTDLINAGAHWIDQEVVVDNGWVTSRKPDDLTAFCRKMIEEFREGEHDPQKRKMRTSASQRIDQNVHH